MNPATTVPRYDVAIIGFGPTGATAANLLGKRGLKVVVVERDPDVYGRARAISTDEEVMRIWQSVGLADRLQQDMVTDRPVAFVDANGTAFIEAELSSHGAGHPPQQFIYQPAVDGILREGLARFDNVDVLLDRECVRVTDTDDGVELVLADPWADTFGRVRASYVIAADGGSSSTRGQLGVGYVGRTYGERWVVIDTEVLVEWPGHDRLRFHCNPERPMVDCPTPLGHHRWEFPVLPGEDEKALLTDEGVWSVLRRQGIAKEQVRIQRAVVYSHHVRVADRWRIGNVFLAGDAAHAMPPWNGQGMSAGVRDAANLCWKLAHVVHGDAPDSLLDTYQAERMPHVVEVTRRAVFTGRIITERRRVVASLRDHLIRRVIRIPGAISTFERLSWIPIARYKQGFLSGQRHPAVGWQIPQPWVLSARGTAMRLDDVLGASWALIYTGAPPGNEDAWTSAGIPAIRVISPSAGPDPEAFRDSGGMLTDWMKDKGATALVVRPDGFVYAATGDGTSLPNPPRHFKISPASLISAPTKGNVTV